MNRLLELNIGDESEVVTRILVAVHQAIDTNFANAAAPPRRFTKTTFTDHLEDTNLNPLPGYDGGSGNDVAVTKEKMVRLDQPLTEKTDEEPRALSKKAGEAPAAEKQEDSLFFSHMNSVIPNDDSNPGQSGHTDLKKIARPKSKFLKAIVLMIILMTMLGLAALWLANNLGVKTITNG